MNAGGRRHASQYLDRQVLTASREQLLLLTYDGVLRFLGQARRGIEERDWHAKHVGITRAQALLIDLRRTLDFSASPALAHNLARIYTFLVEELAKANVEAEGDQGGEQVARVAALVGELRAAWQEATVAAAGQRPEGEA